jgi:hypothetical protein
MPPIANTSRPGDAGVCRHVSSSSARRLDDIILVGGQKSNQKRIKVMSLGEDYHKRSGMSVFDSEPVEDALRNRLVGFPLRA